MGKHTAKNGVAQTRSRGRRDPAMIRSGEFPKNMRRCRKRLGKRIKYYNEVLSKSPRHTRYKPPGSMKARTN